MSAQKALTVLIIILGLVLVLAYFGSSYRNAKTSEESIKPVVALPEANPQEDLKNEPERKVISKEIVEDLHLGHTYESVEELFGISADKRESEYHQGIEGYTSPYTVVWYTWENPDETQVRLGFINNKLDRKVFIHADGHRITNEIDLEKIN